MAHLLSRIAHAAAALLLAGASAAGAASGGSTGPWQGTPPELDPCLTEPGGCGEEDPGGPQIEAALDPDYAFLGVERFRVKGSGQLLDTAHLKLQIMASMFRAEDEDDALWKGVWQPQGSSGLRFRLILDTASRAALQAKLSAGASAAVGQPLAVTLVGTPKLVLELSEDGSEGSLRVRAKGHAGGLAVRYRAQLEGGATSLPAPLP